MFESFASRLDAQIERRPLFERSVHFAGEHDTEILARIGPLPQFSDRSAPTVIDQHLEETKV
jgi:hypothetical protein